MTPNKVTQYMIWLSWFKTENLKPKNYFAKLKNQKQNEQNSNHSGAHK